MKLGVSINLFDSEELLKPQLISLRPYVDFISVVWQKKSNWGNPAPPYMQDLLRDLKSERLIDKIEEYVPNQIHNAQSHEVKKRNQGLRLSRDNRCDFHASLDCDEFYYADDILRSRAILRRDNNLNGLVAHIQDYYKLPTHKITNLQGYYVPFIYRIPKRGNYMINASLPVLVDPTRKMALEKVKLLSPEELTMHHMTTVRANIDNLFKKFNNSSGKGHWGSNPMIVAKRIWDYDYNTNNHTHNSDHPVIELVNDHFDIIPLMEEFKRKYL